jgi:single-stranded DNA-binding protein
MSYFSAAVYVEGDIETRVYNDRINNQVKNIPEICVRRDGMLIWGLSTDFFSFALL